MNKPVAWLWVHKGTTMNALLRDPMCDEYGKKHFEPKGWSSIPLYTHPVKPAICVGYWDNKTGAFHKHLTESQQKRVDEGFLQPVYTAGMLPVKELTLTDEDILEQWTCKYSECYQDTLIDFAKAILRKAQEKC